MNTISIKQLEDAIEWYSKRFNIQFSYSEIYALHPKHNEYGWPETWPNDSKAGVYALLNANYNVVYVGKAKCLGARLSHYFKYGNNGECILNDNRVKDVFFIKNYATKDDEKYACLSLEEYLISNLNPIYNTKSRTDW